MLRAAMWMLLLRALLGLRLGASPPIPTARRLAAEPVLVASEIPTASGNKKEVDGVRTCEITAPFKKVMAANRAEIAVRIMRACTELNMETVGIFGEEDRYSQHRWGADQSFQLEKKDPLQPAVKAYLDIEQIVRVAVEQNVEAIHPGYGFLSESPEFAQACADANVTFIGPTVENLKTFADKTSARVAAIAANVPVVPGTDEPVMTAAVPSHLGVGVSALVHQILVDAATQK